MGRDHCPLARTDRGGGIARSAFTRGTSMLCAGGHRSPAARGGSLKASAGAVAVARPAAACTGAAAADDGYYRGRYGSRGYGYDTFRIGFDNGYGRDCARGAATRAAPRVPFLQRRRFRRGGTRAIAGPSARGTSTCGGSVRGYERGYRPATSLHPLRTGLRLRPRSLLQERPVRPRPIPILRLSPVFCGRRTPPA